MVLVSTYLASLTRKAGHALTGFSGVSLELVSRVTECLAAHPGRIV